MTRTNSIAASRIRRTITAVLATAATAGALTGAAALTAAHAESPASLPAQTGPRIAKAANIRIAPSTHVDIRTVYPAGTPIAIGCVAPGTEVDGNRNWYALTDDKGWVSATLVSGASNVKPCHGGTSGYKAIVSADLNVRHGPSTGDQKIGMVAKGSTVTLVCSASIPVVNDQVHWFLLSGGNWVAGAYVPSAPPDVPKCAD